MTTPVDEMKAPYTCDLKALFALHLLKWFSSENAQAILLWVMGNKWWVLYGNNACQSKEKRDYLDQLSLKLGSLYRTETFSFHDWINTLITAAFIFEATHDYFKEKSATCLRHNRADSSKKFCDRQWSFLDSLKVIISNRKKIEFYKILLCLFLV